MKKANGSRQRRVERRAEERAAAKRRARELENIKRAKLGLPPLREKDA